MDAITLTLVPLVLGYALDCLLGDPRWLPHPIVGFGRVIAWGDRRLNRGSERAQLAKGAALTLVLVASTYASCLTLLALAFRINPVASALIAGLGVFFGLANRTLVDEGRAVFRALDESLDAGRRRLGRIVGRDTAPLDAQQVRTAVFETMAENLSDGVVAPLFYYALGGVPAMLAYKMVNTLDSMIGHRDERHEWFGKFAARLDDTANFIPARMTALSLALVARSVRGLSFIRRYGRAHASPNAGYPEAALAGILDVRFGGPLAYGGEVVAKPWIGENPRAIQPGEFERVARLNHAVCFGCVVLIGGIQWMVARCAS